MKKKISLIAILILLSAAAFTACDANMGKFYVNFDRQDGSPVTTQSQWIRLNKSGLVYEPDDPVREGYIFDGWYKEPSCENKWDFDKDTLKSDDNITLYAKFTVTDYGNIPGVYSGTVLEKELLLNAAFVSDGYLLSTRDGVEKYSLAGGLQWHKEYSFIPKDENAISRLRHLKIVPCADDSFIIGFSFERYWNNDGPVYYDPVLAKCDKNGDLVWQKEYKGFDVNAFEKIFILDDGKIYTIGATEQPGTGRQSDIYISLLKPDGSIIDEQYYGGPAMMDMFRDAGYVEGIGLVALINAQSGGSYFSSPDSGNLLVMFNNNLSIEWSIAVPLFFRMAVTDEAIYLINSSNVTADSIIRKIDFSGKIVFDETIDNRIDVATNFVGNSQHGLLIQKGKELAFYRDRTVLLSIAFDAGNAYKIIGHDDGFIIVSVKITGILPSPLFISSIWYSTEIIYGGYDMEGKLLWQCAYDNTPAELYEASKQYQS